MMRAIVETSIRFRSLLIGVAAGLVVVGATQLWQMPVDVLPEFAPPYVEVQTEALGLSADEVESLVSLNLEELLNGTPWLQSIHSRSVPGLSSIVLVFEPGTDVIRARQLVTERLALAYTLPNVSKPPVVLQPVSATSRVMLVGLSSRDTSLIDMSVLARWNIRPALLAVPGVANVSVWGMRERQLQVQVDPEQLRASDVSLDQIVEAAGDAVWVSPLTFLNASTPGSGGWIDTPQQRLEVRHDQPILEAGDLAKVPIGGTSFRLGDVAQVVEDHQPLIGDAVLRDGHGLLLVIEKFPGANTLEVTRGVEAALNALRPGLRGIEIDTSLFRPASFIDEAISNLGLVLIIGALLAILVLSAFLWNWRVAVISVAAVALSLTAAGLVLFATGTTMNTMVLAGLVIALGLIVDDAIVDVEHIVGRLRRDRHNVGKRTATQAIIDASLQIRRPLMYATLVMILAISPVFFLRGIAGSFFGPLAFSYMIALAASLAVALTVTPALSSILLTRAPRRESPLVTKLQRHYQSALGRILPMVRRGVIATIGLLLLGVLVLPLLGQSLLPPFRDADMKVRWEGAPGTSYPEMYRLVSQASAEVQKVPGVRNVAGQIGRAVLGDQVVGINSAQLWISIDPSADQEATQASIDRLVDGYPGFAGDVNTYLSDTVQQVLAGSSDDIVVRVMGPAWGTLKAKAEEVRTALSTIAGTSVRTEPQVLEPYIQIEVDLAKAEGYGIKPGDVRRAASTYLAGLQVGTLFEEQKTFDVVVWGTPATRNSLTSIRELLIDAPNGGHVRLEDVADVRVASTQQVINRDAVSRRIDIGLTATGRDPASVVADVEQRLAQIQFPLEYHAELLGEYAERQAAQGRLLGFGLAALIGIFLLLQAAFGSWRLATLLMVTLPMALVGGVLATLLGGGILSIGSLVGFVTVLGIAARNGIMLINHYQHLEREEGEAFGPDLVLRGARERLSPIMMTSLAAGLALLPLVIAGDRPGFEIVRPMAIVILGGLVTSTLLTLFVLPTLYLGVQTMEGTTFVPGRFFRIWRGARRGI